MTKSEALIEIRELHKDLARLVDLERTRREVALANELHAACVARIETQEKEIADLQEALRILEVAHHALLFDFQRAKQQAEKAERDSAHNYKSWEIARERFVQAESALAAAHREIAERDAMLAASVARIETQEKEIAGLQHAIAIREMKGEMNMDGFTQLYYAALPFVKLAATAEGRIPCDERLSFADWDELCKAFNACTPLLAASAQNAAAPVAWLPLKEAPMYVYGRDALVGEFVPQFGWKKVSIWEREWTRDEIIARGGTHWWPHLRDLPPPIAPVAKKPIIMKSHDAGGPMCSGSIEDKP